MHNVLCYKATSRPLCTWCNPWATKALLAYKSVEKYGTTQLVYNIDSTYHDLWNTVRRAAASLWNGDNGPSTRKCAFRSLRKPKPQMCLRFGRRTWSTYD